MRQTGQPVIPDELDDDEEPDEELDELPLEEELEELEEASELLLSKNICIFPSAVTKIKSSSPSLFISPLSTEEGFEVSGTSKEGVNEPFPFPLTIEEILVLFAVIMFKL